MTFLSIIRRCALWSAASIALVTLSGCGQTGPLYLPDDPDRQSRKQSSHQLPLNHQRSVTTSTLIIRFT